MSRLSPYIPLVQNGSLSVEQFKMHIDGFREATQRDFDTYLLDWLRIGLRRLNGCLNSDEHSVE